MRLFQNTFIYDPLITDILHKRPVH